MSFTIRAPRPDDAEALAHLHVQTWREAYGHLLPSDFFDDELLDRRREQWRAITERPGDTHTVRVAERGGELIGFAAGGRAAARGGTEPPPGARELFMLYVSAAHYGSGAGQALFDAVLPDGPALLWVAEDNPRAIAFYRRNGFAFDGTTQTDAATPGIREARMIR